jgi:hypothetical protein
MSADPRPVGTAPMDYKEHESTYALFVAMTSVFTPVFITWLLAVGIGGMKHHPFIAALVVILSFVVTVIGLARRPANMAPAMALMVISFLAFVVL